MTREAAAQNRQEKELQTAKDNVAVLQREAALQRLFVSQTAAEMVVYTTAAQEQDPLANPEKFKNENPFLQSRRRFCVIM